MNMAIESLKLKSPAFKHGKPIPRKYSGEGENISPPLHFEGTNNNIKSYVVFCHDPDAPMIKPNHYGFVHWVMYNIPGDITTLEEKEKAYTQGVNDANRVGYIGPMPPKKHGKHHYFFVLIALKRQVKLEKGLSLTEVLKAVEPYTIGVARLLGTYKRK